jgi:hypothetical protein
VKSAVKFNNSWYKSEEGALAKFRDLKRKYKDKPDSIWYRTDVILERDGCSSRGQNSVLVGFLLLLSGLDGAACSPLCLADVLALLPGWFCVMQQIL